MQSHQETVLEEFIQRSFGAQFLYLPKKYAKGSAHREPADLAWVAQDSVILFYLRSSKEKLADQVDHNRRQAAGYHRLWSTKKTAYALRGTNRFGDECFVPYSSVRNYLSILVVSEECDIHFIPALTKNIANAVIVIPELLLHWVSEFGGTIVDLLFLIDIGSTDKISSQNDERTPLERTLSFSKLKVLVVNYIAESFNKADPQGRYIYGIASNDFFFLKEHLSRMRLSASMAGVLKDIESRKTISGVFGDLMLIEYASLAASAEFAIQESKPPFFRKWVVLKLQGSYYSFVVGTIHMGSNNAMEAMQAVLDACKNDEGMVSSISVQYGNVLDANEYRVPLMITLPPILPRKHHEVLIEKIIERTQGCV